MILAETGLETAPALLAMAAAQIIELMDTGQIYAATGDNRQESLVRPNQAQNPVLPAPIVHLKLAVHNARFLAAPRQVTPATSSPVQSAVVPEPGAMTLAAKILCLLTYRALAPGQREIDLSQTLQDRLDCKPERRGYHCGCEWPAIRSRSAHKTH